MFTLIAAIRASQRPVSSAQRCSAHEESCTGSGPYQGDEREEGAACQATPARVCSPSYIITFGQRRLDQHQASLWHQMESFACKTRQWDGLHPSICERSHGEEGKTSKMIGPTLWLSRLKWSNWILHVHTTLCNTVRFRTGPVPSIQGASTTDTL